MQRNIMTVLLFNFLIAVAVTLAACAVIAFILTNVVVGWIKGSLYRDVLRNFWSKNRKDILRGRTGSRDLGEVEASCPFANLPEKKRTQWRSHVKR